MTHPLTVGIYPGTFDPITYGHIDLIERALGLFDQVIVAVAHHTGEKKALFSVDQRVRFVRESVRGLRRVEVEAFRGLVVDYARKKKAAAMIRGVRMLSDFEYEFQMALTNRKLSSAVETVFLMPHEKYAYLSSRLIKEAASLGADMRAFVPPNVWKVLERVYRR